MARDRIPSLAAPPPEARKNGRLGAQDEARVRVQPDCLTVGKLERSAASHHAGDAQLAGERCAVSKQPAVLGDDGSRPNEKWRHVGKDRGRDDDGIALQKLARGLFADSDHSPAGAASDAAATERARKYDGWQMHGAPGDDMKRWTQVAPP